MEVKVVEMGGKRFAVQMIARNIRGNLDFGYFVGPFKGIGFNTSEDAYTGAVRQIRDYLGNSN